MLAALFIVWIFLATARTLMYLSQAIEDVYVWYPLNSDKKKIKLYGRVYSDYLKVNSVMKENSTGIFIDNNAWEFYLLRYQLYPKRIYWNQDLQNADSSIDYNYIITQDEAKVPNNSKKVIIKLE